MADAHYYLERIKEIPAQQHTFVEAAIIGGLSIFVDDETFRAVVNAAMKVALGYMGQTAKAEGCDA